MSCLCFCLLIFLLSSLCRSWECQVGTSRRTGSQHQHNPPRVEPLQSPPLSPPVSHPVSVPTLHQRWAAGKFDVLKCWFLFSFLIIFLRRRLNGRCPQLTCCFALLWANAGAGCSWVPHLSWPHLSSAVPTPAQTWEETKAKEERDGPSLELGL